jgi:hypothetical protein
VGQDAGWGFIAVRRAMCAVAFAPLSMPDRNQTNQTNS